MPETLMTAEEVGARLPDLADSPALDDLVAAASEAVAGILGRPVLEAEAEERIDGAGWSRLWLRRTPVASVSAVSIDGTAEDVADFDFNPRTGEFFRSGGGDVRHGLRFPRGRGNVRVTYTGGYASTPYRVREALLLIVRALATSDAFAAKGAGLLTSYSFAGESFGFADGSKVTLPALALDLLSDFAGDGIN